ncbi:hypothetical protein Patl1_26550 [Pistacia atlantica]|uniref:Uncharacterized protein n=1 Tax=Pistacia atlantica TaxID=434234 RepID=A0ACC1AZN9_9ROSI|nr:hypothetical protein Patl1_26550 [Pistacia atlantica]
MVQSPHLLLSLTRAIHRVLLQQRGLRNSTGVGPFKGQLLSLLILLIAFHSQYEEFRFQVPGHEPWHSIEGRSRGGGMVDKERLFSHRKLTETVFVTAAQGALALFTFLFAPGGGSSTGYLTCCSHDRKPGASTILTGVGCATTVYGFLAVMGVVLHDHLILWVFGGACIASTPAIAIFLQKKTH